MKLTKKQQQLAQNYFNAIHQYGLRDVSNVYQNPSYAKLYAENGIFDEMYNFNTQENGFRACDYTVIGYNCMMFSSAYVIRDDITQIIVALVYHTAYNRYIIPFNDKILNDLEGIL